MWTLYICTASWLLCGQIREIDYQTEQQCYKALEEIYKRQPASDFKYIICSPKGAIRSDG